MQYLIMCEGPNEKAIVDMLIDSNKLIVNRNDLLNREVFFARQIDSSPNIKIALETYNKKVVLWRIGDKLSEKIRKINKYQKYIETDKIKKFCTKPELEILLIINFKLIKEYNKEKSKTMPKEYSKKNIKLNGKKYNNSTNQLKEYYSDNID